MHGYAVTLLCVLGAAAAVPVAAQQRPDSTAAAPAARVDTAQTTAPLAPTAGPRVESRWQSFQPRLDTRSTPLAPLQEGRTHTFRLTTLALILIGVIVLLLIIR